MNPISLPEEDAELIKQAQRTAMLRDPSMAAATLTGAQAEAMKTAAGNKNGAMMGFMGLGMAQQAGGLNAQELYAMGQQQKAAPAAPAADGWKCSCGATATGNFCPSCGAKKPQPARKRLDVHLRPEEHRKILLRLRQAAPCRGLDLRLRHGESGQVLPELRREEARERAAVPL